MRLLLTPLLLAPLLLTSGCAWLRPEKEIVTVTNTVPINIPVVARPKPVNLIKSELYVVTEKNYEQFIKDFKSKNGETVYIAISVKDYENLAINISELRRYINQQKEIIVYYETAIKQSNDNINKLDIPKQK